MTWLWTFLLAWGQTFGLWQLSFQDSQGKHFPFASLRGRPFFVSFFYSRCPMPTMCPRTLDLHAQLEKALSSTDALQPVLITLDPERDTPKVLSNLKRQYHLGSRTVMVTAKPQVISEITAAFNILSIPKDGMISHSSKSILVGKDGNVVKEFLENRWTPKEVLAFAVIASEAKRSQKRN